ncbi:Calcipressin [Nakaseomyces glabratus]|nr:Calcipressin [Nakaseomyces glabratus]KAH7595945.1 Calcipressin [Nakaseomyces glabratus]
MDSLVTDTIILTSNERDITGQEILPILASWFEDNVLSNIQVLPANPIQLLLLKNFKRCLIICPDHAVSNAVMQKLKLKVPLPDLIFNYSITDSQNNSSVKKDYLKVPEHQRLFLISPPSSPPPEFDYSKCEDKPSFKTHAHQPEKILRQATSFVAIESQVGTITVNTCDDYNNGDPGLEGVRTALPPKSIFDDIDE